MVWGENAGLAVAEGSWWARAVELGALGEDEQWQRGEEQPDGAGGVYGFYSAETSAFPLNKPSARGAVRGF